jgi:hypothetical protein
MVKAGRRMRAKPNAESMRSVFSYRLRPAGLRFASRCDGRFASDCPSIRHRHPQSRGWGSLGSVNLAGGQFSFSSFISMLTFGGVAGFLDEGFPLVTC